MAEERRDREQLAELFNGCSQSMLSQIFRMDPREIARRISPVPPTGERGGFPTYDLATVAPYICDPVIDLQAYLQQLKPKDLPSTLQKAYWDAQNARSKWEENARKLWRTESVIEVFSAVFKKIRSKLVMFEDTVEAATTLTDAQRRACRKIADSLLEDIREGLIEEFQVHGSLNEYHRSEHGASRVFEESKSA